MEVEVLSPPTVERESNGLIRRTEYKITMSVMEYNEGIGVTEKWLKDLLERGTGERPEGVVYNYQAAIDGEQVVIDVELLEEVDADDSHIGVVATEGDDGGIDVQNLTQSQMEKELSERDPFAPLSSGEYRGSFEMEIDPADVESLELLLGESPVVTPKKTFGESPMKTAKKTPEGTMSDSWRPDPEKKECLNCEESFIGGKGVEGDDGEEMCSLSCVNEYYG